MGREKEVRPHTDQGYTGAHGIQAEPDYTTGGLFDGISAREAARMTAACAALVVGAVLALDAFAWVVGCAKGWW